MRLVARRTHAPIKAIIDTIASDIGINQENPILIRDGERSVTNPPSA